MISNSTIDKIFSTARIEEVIGEFVSLKKSGSNYKGLSPFTEEKTPSFFVSPSKQIFKCFSSGVGGNVVKFLMELEHMTYPEALRFLAEKYNIEIEEEGTTPEEDAERSERESLYIVTKFAEDFFIEKLHSEEGIAVGLSYFKERGFSTETIEKFKLGYSPDLWDAFLKEALEKGYKEEYLIKTGLIKESSNGKKYDGYKGRVIFPIHNLSGRPIGFGGRTLKTDKKVPKYINSPESEIYDKSNVLYGLYQAKGEVIKQDNCLLVEGYTDVTSLAQSGITNVVSSSGTSLTQGQIRLISRYTKNITILYDGDAAGIKASFRGIDLILEEGLNVKIVLFPEGEDPDSYSKKLGSEELKTFIEENAKDFIVFKSGVLLKDTKGDPIKKSGIIHDIVNSISFIPDHITRSLYIKECSNILDIPEKALIGELNKLRKNRLDKKIREKERGASTPPLPDNVPLPTEENETQNQFFEDVKELAAFDFEFQERDIVRLLLNYGQDTIVVEIENEETGEQEEVETILANYIISEILSDELVFKNPAYQQIFDEYVDLFASEKEISQQHFINHTNELISKMTVDLLSFPYDLHEWEKKNIFVTTEKDKLVKAGKGAIYSLKTKHIQKLIAELQEQIKSAYEKGEDFYQFQGKQVKLENIKRELSKEQGITILR